MFKLVQEEKGLALVTTVLILMLLFALGTALLSISTTEGKIAINQKRAIQALYLAEAGINLALAELKADPNLLDHSNNYTLLSEPIPLGSQQGIIKHVQLKKIYAEDDILGLSIESLGEISRQNRKVVVTVELIKNTGPRKVVAGSLNLHNGTVNGDLYLLDGGDHYVDNVNGNIWVNGNIYVEGIISGDVFATGKIVERNGGKIQGRKYEFSELEWEEIDLDDILDWFASQYDPNGGSEPSMVFIDGDANEHSIVNGKTNVVTGDVFLRDDDSYYGTIICGGTLELSNSSFRGIIIARNIISKADSDQISITVDNHPQNIGEVIMPPQYREAAIRIMDWRDEKY